MRGVSILHSLLLALLVLVVASAPVRAQDDRSLIDPTGWYWLHGVTSAQIDDLINDEGARLVDLEIESTNPLLFSAAFVHNSGSYARGGWWWLFGQTSASLTTFLGNTPGARIIDLERYEVFGTQFFAAVMVDDGADAPAGWWWYFGLTAADITNFINLNNMRLIDLEEYDVGGSPRYAVVGVSNTGSWARNWWWWLGADDAFLNNFAANNNARILDINVDPSLGAPFFNAILVANTGPAVAWWWYYGFSAGQLPALYEQNGARIADIEPYFSGLNKRFAVMMLCNVNGLTKSIAAQLGWGADGATGFYLKKVGGPVLASLQPDYIFEPASTIKVIHNFHAMRQVELGATNLGVNLNYSINYNGSCPIGGAPFTNQSLSGTLADMMQLSDNAATQGIDIFFGGDAPIEFTAQAVAGMVDTQLNHTLGCGAQQLVSPNRLTLLDAASLYEGVANGNLLNDRETFYDHMQSEETAAPWWFTNDIRNMIFTEAANIGFPNAAASYWAETELAWKPGGYDIFDGLGQPHMYRSVAGWVSLPECGGRVGLVNNEYVFGLFIDDADDPNFADNRLFGVTKELFRQLIRDGLRTCPTDGPEMPVLAKGRRLAPNHPNPFNPSTTLRYRLAGAGPAHLSVVDVRGQVIVVLVDETMPAGPHEVSWNGRDAAGRPVASGVYFARLEAEGVVETSKMALLK